jgi:hypothetical protein
MRSEIAASDYSCGVSVETIGMRTAMTAKKMNRSQARKWILIQIHSPCSKVPVWRASLARNCWNWANRAMRTVMARLIGWYSYLVTFLTSPCATSHSSDQD